MTLWRLKFRPKFISEKFKKCLPSQEVYYNYDSLEMTSQKLEVSSLKKKQKIAIIIPYRNRPEHLKKLLKYLHPALKNQKINYQIYIINLGKSFDDPIIFNRGLLLNIGINEVSKIDPEVNCFVAHDVDLIPEAFINIENHQTKTKLPMYTCNENSIRHYAAIDKYNYKLTYDGALGGMTFFTKNQILNINGYTNLFYGWGGEDDDLAIRAISSCQVIEHVLHNDYNIKMIVHQHDSTKAANDKRQAQIINASERQFNDGLNNVEKYYKVIGENDSKSPVDVSGLYSNITVEFLNEHSKNFEDNNNNNQQEPKNCDYLSKIAWLSLLFLLYSSKLLVKIFHFHQEKFGLLER